MKGRRAAPAPGGRESEGGHHAPDCGLGARTPRPALAAAAAAGSSCSHRYRRACPHGACPRAPARASRRAAPGVPGWGRPGARARGRGRCPAAVLPGPGDRSRERGPGRRVATPTPSPGPARASCAPPAHPPASGDHCLIAAGRGGRAVAPLARCAPGSRGFWNLLWGCLGCPERGGEHAVHSCLLEDLVERHHRASLLGFAGFLVLCFAQTQTLLTNVASVYFWVGLLPLCLKQDCNVTTALV